MYIVYIPNTCGSQQQRRRSFRKKTRGESESQACYTYASRECSYRAYVCIYTYIYVQNRREESTRFSGARRERCTHVYLHTHTYGCVYVHALNLRRIFFPLALLCDSSNFFSTPPLSLSFLYTLVYKQEKNVSAGAFFGKTEANDDDERRKRVVRERERDRAPPRGESYCVCGYVRSRRRSRTRLSRSAVVAICTSALFTFASEVESHR